MSVHLECTEQQTRAKKIQQSQPRITEYSSPHLADYERGQTLVEVTLLFRFNYSHVLPVNHDHRYVQRMVQATSPQSMNVGGIVQKLRTIFITQGQHNIRSHSRATRNQHFHRYTIKKGNGTLRKTKVSP